MNAKAREAVGETRTKLYQELMALMYDEEPYIPIGHMMFQYGLSKRLEWRPRLDGFILAKEMSLAK